MTRKGYSKYSEEALRRAAAESVSVAEVMRALGITYASGGMHFSIKTRMVRLGIDTSHFLGSAGNRGQRHVGGPARLTAKDIFVYDRRGGYREKAHNLRRALDEIGRARVCVECGGGETWQGESIVLEVEHRNGDFLDNRANNLEYLCPNCHSQVPIVRSKVAQVA